MAVTGKSLALSFHKQAGGLCMLHTAIHPRLPSTTEAGDNTDTAVTKEGRSVAVVACGQNFIGDWSHNLQVSTLESHSLWIWYVPFPGSDL